MVVVGVEWLVWSGWCGSGWCGVVCMVVVVVVGVVVVVVGVVVLCRHIKGCGNVDLKQ